MVDVQPPIFERRAITIKNKLPCRPDQIVLLLQSFYSNPDVLTRLLPILQGTSAISLRLVDYFVTNYAKKMNTSYMIGDKHFLVYFNYKHELRAYSKRLFDPFCRRERITFEVADQPKFITTVGQLNFFRWFFEKQIYEYVTANRETIEKDMNQTLKVHYSRTASTLSSTTSEPTQSNSTTSTLSTDSTKQRKKRCEVTKNAMKKVNVHECDVTVSFS